MAHVAVLGCGIVGVCTGIRLLEAGFKVTLVAPDEPGSAASASYGNGAWFSPASVVPMSMPGLWRRVPGMLRDPAGPLTLRWSAVPRMTPWLLRFLYAGATVRRVEATARALRPLLEAAPALHEELAEKAGVPDLIRRDGLIYAYASRKEFQTEALAWRLRRENGVDWSELEGEALRAAVPALSEIYTFGALVPTGAHCLDPGGYVAALARSAVDRGAKTARARATGFTVDDGRLVEVKTDKSSLLCDHAVICAGIHSRDLARAAGDSPSLESERGYHVVIADPEVAPAIPVQPADTRMGMTLTKAGLRGAGQVELCHLHAGPDWRRAEILLRHLKRAFPGLPSELDGERVQRWMGHRPSTPDGLPVIGTAASTRDIVHAYGHGHVGLASAPMTARLVVEILRGVKPTVPLAPYSADRFNGWWPQSAAAIHDGATRSSL